MSGDPLDAVAEAVRAVVERDEAALAEMAPDAGDLYVWTRNYGAHGDLELVMPPDPPPSWDIDWSDLAGGDRYAAVGMWSRQEGRSDLTLELWLSRQDDGRWRPRIRDLHVL